MMTADTHLLFRWINNKQTNIHTQTKRLKTWSLLLKSLLVRGNVGEKQEEVSYLGAKQVVATQPQ